MKKYKEWLKNEIEIMGSETSENYPHEQMVGREEVLNLIDQLYELNRPLVVPNELGEWLSCQALGDEGSLFITIDELEGMWVSDGCEGFITDNKKQLIEVILGNRGYEVEKEKRYRVIIPTKDKLWNYYYLDDDGGINITNNLKYVDSHTEEFIRSVSDDLWQFAVEVTG